LFRAYAAPANGQDVGTAHSQHVIDSTLLIWNVDGDVSLSRSNHVEEMLWLTPTSDTGPQKNKKGVGESHAGYTPSGASQNTHDTFCF